MTRIKRNLIPLIFLFPGFLGFMVFFIIPGAVSVYYSFLTKPVGGAFTGFTNYASLLASKSYTLGLTNTGFFMLVCLPLNMLFSLITALLVKNSGRCKAAFTLIFLAPLVIPSGGTVFFWKIMFNYNGFANNVLNSLGGHKINWLESNTARFVVTLIFIWKNLGYNMVLFLAGLGNIPKEYYDAAYVDGAGSAKAFFRITLPCLMPTLVLITIMSVVNSFKVFKEIYMLMGDYPHESVYMLQHFMNNNFLSLNYPRLTTAATVLAVIVAAATQGLFRAERKISDG